MEKAQLKVQVWIYRHLGWGAGVEVLLLKLCEGRGGFWQPVTGGVETGETSAEAAFREATEESGLAFVDAPTDLDFEFSYEGSGPRAGISFCESAFGLRADGALGFAARLDPREHIDSLWVEPDLARSMLRYDSNRAGLAALLRKIAPVA